MKTIGYFKAAAVAGAVMLGVLASPASAKDWRGWNIHVPGYPNTVALDQFAKEITDKTGGRINVKPYHGGVLGSQPDAIEQTRNGALDFANFSMGPMGPIIPATNILSLPFLFKGEAHMHRVMDGPVGQKLSDAMSEKGLVSVGWYDAGSRSFYNSKKPIMTPDDLKGMKIRVMNNELYVQMVGEMGGNATPMAFAEVFQSLKTGVIDGAENNYPSFESTNHFEVAKYYSITEHLIIPECICIAKASWDKLSKEDQAIVREAGKNSSALQRKLWAERSIASRKKVEASGVKVNDVQNKQAFQDAMKPVYDAFIKKNPDLAALIKEVQSTP